MIRTLIIDDELASRKILMDILKSSPFDIDLIGEAESVKDGTGLITGHRPELIFLDIQMPDGSGFEILRKLEGQYSFEVIFVTAHDQYAIDAIRFSALDYLLKPLNPDELRASLRRAVEKIKQRQEKENQNQLLKVLMDNIHAQTKQARKLVIPDVRGFKVVEISDIVRFEGMRNYTQLVFANGNRATVSKILREYEAMLDPYDFMRIHQSHIINLNFVKRYIRGNAGQVEMNDGTILPLSRKKKDAFLAHFAS